MLDGFTTIDFILSFPGMIIVIGLLTQMTKKFWDKLGFKRTKYVVLVYALLLCLLAAILNGDFSSPMMYIQTIVVWLVNMVAVWFAAMKAFETVGEESPQIITIVNTEDDEVYKEAFDVAVGQLKYAKTVQLKVDTSLKPKSEKPPNA